MQPGHGLLPGARLAVVEASDDRQTLVVVDAATGDRTHLGETAGDVGSVAWSPDGSQIAYGAVPTGSRYANSPDGSVYSVDVGGGDHVPLASSVGTVSVGEEGSGIRWSPDGTRIAVTAFAQRTGRGGRDRCSS